MLAVALARPAGLFGPQHRRGACARTSLPVQSRIGLRRIRSPPASALATGNVTIRPTGNALVVINTTTGLVVPVGNISQRPGSPSTGTLRFNTETERMEVYDGTEWDSVVSEVTNQTLNGDNVTVVFTLDRATTAAAVLIILNGVVKLPDVAYTVAGNVVTFAQAPAITDVIDVRFL